MRILVENTGFLLETKEGAFSWISWRSKTRILFKYLCGGLFLFLWYFCFTFLFSFRLITLCFCVHDEKWLPLLCPDLSFVFLVPVLNTGWHLCSYLKYSGKRLNPALSPGIRLPGLWPLTIQQKLLVHCKENINRAGEISDTIASVRKQVAWRL